MDKWKSWWAAHRPSTRRLVQLYTALMYNAHLRGFAEGKIYTGPAKSVCVPGLNCYSCPGAVAACPLGALQNAISASPRRPAFYALGLLLLFGLALGRVVCGWACPIGLLQELLYKLPVPKVKKSRFTRALSWLKYLILAVFVAILPLWYALRDFPLPAFCKYICPAGTLQGAVGLLAHPANAELFGLLGAGFTWKFILLVLILTASLFIYRFFCRFLCPLGAIYSLFARAAFAGVRVDAARCTGCGACVRCCPVDIRQVGDRECVHCTRCMSVCPEQAISLKAGRWTLKAPPARRSAQERGGEAS